MRLVHILLVVRMSVQGAAAETMAQMWIFVRVGGSVSDELGDVLLVDCRFFCS